VSCNVESSTLEVAKCFADNHYLNVMPRKVDSNGTALISDKPFWRRHSAGGGLRKQFLPYFTAGTFIGDGVLTRATDAFVRAISAAMVCW